MVTYKALKHGKMLHLFFYCCCHKTKIHFNFTHKIIWIVLEQKLREKKRIKFNYSTVHWSVSLDLFWILQQAIYLRFSEFFFFYSVHNHLLSALGFRYSYDSTSFLLHPGIEVLLLSFERFFWFSIDIL